MKKGIKLLLVGMIMAVMLTACGSGSNESDGKKHLKVWVPGGEYEITQKMCDLFLEQHPDDSLQIECLVMSAASAADTLTYDLDGAADVFLYQTGGGRALVNAGLLLPIALNSEELQQNIDSTALRAATFDGYLYGVPVEPNTWIIYYNKNIFNDEDVQSIEGMLGKETGIPYNFSCRISDSWYIEAFYYAAGCTLFGEDGMQEGQCTWNTENGYDASLYLLELINNPAYYEDYDGFAFEYFKSGELGAICGTTWDASVMREILGDDLGAATLPVANISGEEVQLKNFIDYYAFGVKSSTKYPKEAQELAEWLGGEECQLMRYESLGYVPTWKNLHSHPALADDMVATVVLEQMDYCVVEPQVIQMNDYWISVGAFGEAMVNGTVNKDNLQSYLDTVVNNLTTKFVSE